MFVSWCARQAGIPTDIISNAAYAKPDGAANSGGYSFFHVNYYSPDAYIPQTGDLIFFDWDVDNTWDHVGLVYYIENGRVYTIEGNANNQVMIRNYNINDTEIRAYGVPAYTDTEIPPNDNLGITNLEIIRSRIDQLNSVLGNTYFTTTRAACGTYESNHSCDKCYNVNVIASNWFRNIFGTVYADNFPRTYTPNGAGYPRGWSCYGFAAFAEWYIFAGSNSDTVTTSNQGTYAFNYSNMSTHAQIGDLIRLNNSHSAIFISADPTRGIYVLDCNYNWSSNGQCYVTQHYISYSQYSTVTISRSTTAPAPTQPPAEDLISDSKYSAFKGFKAYPCVSENFVCYNRDLTTSPGRIYTSDYCTINDVYTNGWCEVACPWSDGSTKIVYTQISNFIMNPSAEIGRQLHCQQLYQSILDSISFNEIVQSIPW